MKTIREYEAMDEKQQVSFISHAGVDLVQKMYYENERTGLEVFVENLEEIISRAKDCIDCLDILKQEGDVYAKIYLLLEYMGKDGMSEEFLGGLLDLSERAQEAFARNSGATLAVEEEKEVLKRLNAIMNRNEIQGNREAQREAQGISSMAETETAVAV